MNVIIIIYFFFTTPPTTHIYTLSLHDALPISHVRIAKAQSVKPAQRRSELVLLTAGDVRLHRLEMPGLLGEDRKSTRLNSSHRTISYAVFCLKKKKKKLYTLELDTLIHNNNNI